MTSPTRATETDQRRKRLKWEPWALMVMLLGLGMWLVWSPLSGLKFPKPPPGGRQVELRLGTVRGVVQIAPATAVKGGAGVQGGAAQGGVAVMGFVVMLRDGYRSPELTEEELRRFVGDAAFDDLTRRPDNPLFRILNITSWGALAWVIVGFVGQLAFTGRTLVQWLVSEAKRESVVPELFWWLSLTGGVMLFIYFVWRQDFVAVLGQSSGVVIYARNIRLIHKQRRRAMAQTNAES